MKASEFEINLSALDDTPDRPIPARELERFVDASVYQSRWLHLEDQLTSTPDEKTAMLENGVRFRNRIGRLDSQRRWSPLRLRLRDGDIEKVRRFFRENPHWSAADLLNIMQWSDSMEHHCGPHERPYHPGFYIARARDAGFLLHNLMRVLNRGGLRMKPRGVPKNSAEKPITSHALNETPHRFFEAVKKQYLAMRRRFASHKSYNPREFFDGDFNETAKLAEQVNANPYRFVETQFEEQFDRVSGAFPPSPDFMHRSHAIEAFENRRRLREIPMGEMLFEEELKKLRDYLNVSPEKGMSELLAEPYRSLSAHFRILFTSELTLPGMLEIWGDKARAEILYEPSREAFLRTNFPDRFDRFGIG